jgi:hypothetical protein
MDLGSELRTGYVSLKRFHTVLEQRLPDLGHIQVPAVHVVDHLGQHVPVPFMFCSRWEVNFFRSLIGQVTHHGMLGF